MEAHRETRVDRAEARPALGEGVGEVMTKKSAEAGKGQENTNTAKQEHMRERLLHESWRNSCMYVLRDMRGWRRVTAHQKGRPVAERPSKGSPIAATAMNTWLSASTQQISKSQR